MSEILQFSMPKRLMADMRLAISLGDVAKITELYYAMWPDELEQNQKVVLGSGDGSGQYDFPRLGEAIDGMVIAGTTVKSASGESHSMSTEGRGSGEAVRSAQTGSIGESKPLSVPDATVDTPVPREPEAREAAEKILNKELGFAFLAHNSALTVTIFEPKFRVASLHQLDKKWDVVYLMDKAWELLIKLQIDSAELRAERDNAKDANHRAFVAGAKWWEFSRPEGGTMWPSDQHLVIEEATKRWPYVESIQLRIAEARVQELETADTQRAKDITRLTIERDNHRDESEFFQREMDNFRRNRDHRIVQLEGQLATLNEAWKEDLKQWGEEQRDSRASLLQAREAFKLIGAACDCSPTQMETAILYIAKISGSAESKLASTSAPEGDHENQTADKS